MCVISVLPSGYVQSECFPFELYLIGHRPYEISITWTIEEIHPDLNKPHGPGVAQVETSFCLTGLPSKKKIFGV